MEANDLNEDYGENVIIEEEPETPTTPTVEDKLETAGVMKNGEVVEPPPVLTATEQKKVYKRKLTEKRIENLKRAREAKALKKQGGVVKPKASKKEAKAEPAESPAEAPAVTPVKKASAPAKKTKSKMSDVDIDKIVEERLAKRLEEMEPKKTEREEREDYFSKLIFGGF